MAQATYSSAARMPDCSRCRHDQDLRRDWGCDEPAPEPVLPDGIGCSRCGGADPDCGKCNGTNRVELHRCPNSAAREAGLSLEIRQGMQAYSFMDRGGCLPAPGGLDEQAASWVAFCGVVDSERCRIREMERKAAERARSMPSLNG